jgi:hypothetical protein
MLVTFFLVESAWADISYTPAVKTSKGFIFPKIKIYGTITKGDVQQFLLLKDAAKISFQSLPGNERSRTDYGPMMVELAST